LFFLWFFFFWVLSFEHMTFSSKEFLGYFIQAVCPWPWRLKPSALFHLRWSIEWGRHLGRRGEGFKWRDAKRLQSIDNTKGLATLQPRRYTEGIHRIQGML
jgi:hypothetical protein